MSFKGDDHGGNGKNSDEVRKMQDSYIEARIEGKNQAEAKRIAGYNTETKIEVPGSPLHVRIMAILKARGIDDDYLAREYEEGIRMAKSHGARDKDLNAHAQYLKQLSFLMGYAKNSPTVAVQINNHSTAPDGLDAGAVAELMRLVREEISSRESGGVHEADIIPGSPEPHPGVAQASPDCGSPCGGGQP